MKDIVIILCLFFIGFIFGIMLHGAFCDAIHKIPMEALGIDRFQRCEINTTNCHSNWYEIIWKKESGNENK